MDAVLSVEKDMHSIYLTRLYETQQDPNNLASHPLCALIDLDIVPGSFGLRMLEVSLSDLCEAGAVVAAIERIVIENGPSCVAKKLAQDQHASAMLEQYSTGGRTFCS